MSPAASSSDLGALEMRRRRSAESKSHTWASSHWAPCLGVFVKECREIYCLLKTNLELFPSCKSLTQLCYAALYVMDWLSRVCLCHRQPIREQR